MGRTIQGQSVTACTDDSPLGVLLRPKKKKNKESEIVLMLEVDVDVGHLVRTVLLSRPMIEPQQRD